MVARFPIGVKDSFVSGLRRTAESNRNGWWTTHRFGEPCPVPTGNVLHTRFAELMLEVPCFLNSW